VSATQPILRLESVSKRFGGLRVVEDLNLAVRRGVRTALIGPNGAGKTTVFNCLTGFYKPTVGRLLLSPASGGEHLLERMDGYRTAQIARVARTFQNIRLFPRMSVLENLMVAQHNKLMRASGFTVFGLFGLPVYRHAEQKAVELARYWLDRINLTDRADDDAGTLPYGDQRRLEIARAMCTEPHLLCLDEPAAGLNPRESEDLNRLLAFIRDHEKIGILLIEHDMSVVMKISDRIVVLDHGKKISDGPPEFIKNDPAVIRAYLGAEEDEEIPAGVMDAAAASKVGEAP
jgi:branched-chain amino acid transport system ATP-binding protein